MAYKPFIKNANDEMVELPLYADTADKLGNETVGGTNNPVFLSGGVPKKCDRTIPKITLNGSQNITPSFYAPTSAGISGYVLTSNGSGSPSWAKQKKETILWSGVEGLSLSSSDSRPKSTSFTIESNLISNLSDEIYVVMNGYSSKQIIPAYLYQSGDTLYMTAKFDEFYRSGTSYVIEHAEVSISGSGTSYTATLKCDARKFTFASTGKVEHSSVASGYMTLLKIIKVG